MKNLLFLRKKYALLMVLIVTTGLFQSQPVLAFHDFKSGIQEWSSKINDATTTKTAVSCSVIYSSYLMDNLGNTSSMAPLNTSTSKYLTEITFSENITGFGYEAYTAPDNNEQFKHSFGITNL
jgi:hypothetical protein